MANEAVIISLYGSPEGEPVRFSVNDAVGIEKGTLMMISGSATGRYAIASSDAAIGNPPVSFAGIAATEKVANDGSTTLGLWTKGVFDLKMTSGGDGICNAGEMLELSGANQVRRVLPGSSLSGGVIVGKALEAGSASEVINVKLGI